MIKKGDAVWYRDVNYGVVRATVQAVGTDGWVQIYYPSQPTHPYHKNHGVIPQTLFHSLRADDISNVNPDICIYSNVKDLLTI